MPDATCHWPSPCCEVIGPSMLADQSMGTILSNPPYIDAAEPELSGDGVLRASSGPGGG